MNIFKQEEMNAFAQLCYERSLAAGWWNDIETNRPLNREMMVPVKIALIHCELSEAIEAHRRSAMDDKLPNRTGLEVELADTMIRIADLAGAMGLDLGGAIEEKMAVNTTRADHQPENRRTLNGKKY